MPLVKRVDAKLPVAAIADINDEWAFAPGARAIVAALLTSGQIKASEGDASDYIAAIRDWWTPRPASS